MSLSSISACLTRLALLSASTFYCFYKSRPLKLRKFSLNPNPNPHHHLHPHTRKGKLFFISQTGASRTLAQRLHTLLSLNDLRFDLVDPKDYEPEDLVKDSLVIILASTCEDGKPPPTASFLRQLASESADDFRVGSLMLSGCKFAVFGVGSRASGATFNAVAKDFLRRLRELGASEIVAVGEGDVDGGELDWVFEEWSRKVVRFLKGDSVENGRVFSNCKSVSESIVDDFESEDDDDKEENGSIESGIVDLADIAGKGPSRRSTAVVAQTNGKLDGLKEMVTPVIRASLEEGYKIIGSHSGVKICRWTKSQPRG